MPSRRILVVSYPYPPMPTVGGNRWLAMSKYLRRFGHDVTVLTTSAFGVLPDDREREIVRSADLTAAPWLRALLRRPALPKGGESAGIDKPPPGIVTRTVVPDHRAVTWVPTAIRNARRLNRERGFDCIVTTSAYESGHLVPLGLGAGRRPAWVADFRDGWTFHSWRPPFPTAPQRALDRALERKVVLTAERTTVVQQAVGDDFRSRLGVDAAYVPNGWDPDLELEARSAELPPLPEDRKLLVHTGTLTGAWGRHPGRLLDALRRLVERDRETRDRIALVLAGRLDHRERDLIAGSGLEGVIVHLGHLSRAQAMALQCHADGLLLITSSEISWELPGKFFEYLGARRPILALAEGNEVARIVRETGTGLTVPPDDVEAIEGALAGVLHGELAEAFHPRELDHYSYPEAARQMERQIERAISEHAGRRS
jgi:glycosyltransferase involved in cell wall biosynthesis